MFHGGWYRSPSDNRRNDDEHFTQKFIDFQIRKMQLVCVSWFSSSTVDDILYIEIVSKEPFFPLFASSNYEANEWIQFGGCSRYSVVNFIFNTFCTLYDFGILNIFCFINNSWANLNLFHRSIENQLIMKIFNYFPLIPLFIWMSGCVLIISFIFHLHFILLLCCFA